MTKQQAIAALKSGEVLVYCSSVMGAPASAFINHQVVRIDTAKNLMRSILTMTRKSGYTSYWSIAKGE